MAHTCLSITSNFPSTVSTTDKPPEAFIGYGYSKTKGFYQKLCGKCAELERAKQEAKSIGFIVTICGKHAFQLNESISK